MDPMCGIVGVVAERNVVPILIEGLRRLEYRGYDSAGLAVLNAAASGAAARRGQGEDPAGGARRRPISGHVGIAHTRWATHGVPTMHNAHPHVSRDGIAIVHNGIIENHEELRAELTDCGYMFTSETDTEVIAHRIHQHLRLAGSARGGAQDRCRIARALMRWRWSAQKDPDASSLAREGCPVVIGLGIDENFVASDVAALLPVTRRFMFLEEGDVAEVRRKSIRIIEARQPVRARCTRATWRPTRSSAANTGISCSRRSTSSRAPIAQTLEERVAGGRCWMPRSARPPRRFSARQGGAHRRLRHQLSRRAVACHFIEEICRIPARVEIASEYRYRDPVIMPDTLFVTISQSGETADTLAALRIAKQSATCRR